MSLWRYACVMCVMATACKEEKSNGGKAAQGAESLAIDKIKLAEGVDLVTLAARTSIGTHCEVRVRIINAMKTDFVTQKLASFDSVATVARGGATFALHPSSIGVAKELRVPAQTQIETWLLFDSCGQAKSTVTLGGSSLTVEQRVADDAPPGPMPVEKKPE